MSTTCPVSTRCCADTCSRPADDPLSRLVRLPNIVTAPASARWGLAISGVAGTRRAPVLLFGYFLLFLILTMLTRFEVMTSPVALVRRTRGLRCPARLAVVLIPALHGPVPASRPRPGLHAAPDHRRPARCSASFPSTHHFPRRTFTVGALASGPRPLVARPFVTAWVRGAASPAHEQLGGADAPLPNLPLGSAGGAVARTRITPEGIP